MQAELAALQQQHEELTIKIAEEQQGREDSDERNQLVSRLNEQEVQNTKLQDELQLYKDNDPAVVAAKKEATKVARDAANRWTDAVMSAVKYCQD